MSDISGNISQHIGTFWMVKLDKAELAVPASPADTTFQRVAPEMAAPLSQAMGQTDSTEVLHRFSTGRHCYAGFIKDRVATYGWVTFDEEYIGELGLTIRLQADEAYIWDCSTLPDFRGLRLYPALLLFILQELSRQGLRRIWIGADVDNVSSQRGMELAGFQPVMDIGTIETPTGRSLWARAQTSANTQDVEDIYCSLVSSNRPIIRVPAQS